MQFCKPVTALCFRSKETKGLTWMHLQALKQMDVVGLIIFIREPFAVPRGIEWTFPDLSAIGFFFFFSFDVRNPHVGFYIFGTLFAHHFYPLHIRFTPTCKHIEIFLDSPITGRVVRMRSLSSLNHLLTLHLLSHPSVNSGRSESRGLQGF